MNNARRNDSATKVINTTNDAAGSVAVTDKGEVFTQVTTLNPGTAATSLGKAEDSAHASGDVGVMMLSVRKDTAAALAGTDGDYQPPITDASGRMHVNVGVVATVGTIYHNKTTVTTAGTRVALASSQALTAGVYIKALSTNTGLIYVGTSTVSSANGVQLSAKEQIWIPISNLNTINIDSSVNGEGVTYLGW